MIRSVVMLSPEPPYPLHGGGPYRIASLLHYFACFAPVDLILISESGRPAPLPAGLVRSQTVIPLPRHSKTRAARWLRNAGRAVRGVPPLIDRLSGLEAPISAALAGRSWDLALIEHFWCAPYLGQFAPVCARTLLDLFDIESVLHRRCAAVESGLIAAGHRRFARLYEKLEAEYLPRYSLVLTASESDASEVRRLAPAARVRVFPNSLPDMAPPTADEEPRLVFSGNFEYHPNIDAAKFLMAEIWPAVRAAHPGVKLRLVGRGDTFIRHMAEGIPGVEITGPVEDALTEIASARVIVAPLRAGSGTRIKILEAWAAGRAVVATPLAAEGLDARDGENIRLADTASLFIRAVGNLLEDPVARQRLGKNARQTFEERYTWRAAWSALDEHLQTQRDTELNGYTG